MIDRPQVLGESKTALEDLRLERAWIVYPGNEDYAVHEKVRVCPLVQLSQQLASGRLAR